jgi:phage terminase small subunit
MTAEQLDMFNKLTKLQRECALVRIAEPTLNNIEVYRKAGGKAKDDESARACAAEILANPSVKEFIATFNTNRVSDAIMSRDELLQDLTLIARSSLFDVATMVYDDDQLMDMVRGEVLSVGQNSLVLKRMDDLKPEFRKLVKSIKPSAHGMVLELHDPMQARKMLAELQGFNAPKELNVSVTKSLDDFYDEFATNGDA